MFRFLGTFLFIALLSIQTPCFAKSDYVGWAEMSSSSEELILKNGFKTTKTEYFGTDEQRYTSDPNHKGYAVRDFKAKDPKTGEERTFKTRHGIYWKKVSTDCDPCKGLYTQYNNTVIALLNMRYRLVLYKELEKNPTPESIAEAVSRAKDYEKHVGGTGDHYDRYVPSLAVGIGGVIEMSEVLPQAITQMKAVIKKLEALEKDLSAQMKNCDKQCKPDENDNLISLKDPKALILPFPWKGPYSTDCWRCEKLAAHLNTLPGITYPILAEKANLELDNEALKLRQLLLRIENYSDGEDYDRLQSYIDKNLKKIKTLENNLTNIKLNFQQTIALFNDCQKSCKPTKKTSCVFPDSEQPAIQVGPNSEVGTGKAFENKVKDQAKGMAMGAIGGLLGGSPISTGGGGGQKGPKTEKDPTSGPSINVSAGDTDLEIRAELTEDGLVVSTNIDDSPGSGTFQVQWIEDVNGKIYLPIKYLIISLWQDWKLTVWWTYDRYVNGELVEHDEGEEVTFGRTELGTFLFKLQDAEGYKNSIWHTLGFETALKGVKKLGSVYELPPSIMSGPCPVRLVTHITLPKGDPVMTQPVSVMLGGDEASGSTVPVKGWNDEAIQKQQITPPSGLDKLESTKSEPSKKKKVKKKRSYN
jgi:hypothetical protein